MERASFIKGPMIKDAGNPTAKLAQAALDQFNCEPEKYEAAKTTVGEIWAIIYEQKKKANKDYKNYDSYWRNHVSILKNHPIPEIRTMHMQQIIDKFDSYSPQKVIQSMFRWIFEYALANDLVNKDYSAFLKTMAMKHSDMHHLYRYAPGRTGADEDGERQPERKLHDWWK